MRLVTRSSPALRFFHDAVVNRHLPVGLEALPFFLRFFLHWYNFKKNVSIFAFLISIPNSSLGMYLILQFTFFFPFTAIFNRSFQQQ